MSIDYAEVLRLAKKGRRAESRGRSLKKWAGWLLAIALLDLFKGWLFMLAVGIAHAHWWSSIPTIGFWWSVLFIAVLPFGSSSSKSKDG